jgi:pimeloyl-ACP methyl ester carboxylesterase
MAGTSAPQSSGAVDLAVTEYGEDDPRRETVVLLHGLFGSGRNWMTVARRLATSARVLTVDLRNHGASPWAEPMTYPAMAADVARVIVHRAPRPVVLVGHSMGGKAAMALALARPGLVGRLVAVDVAPVTYPGSFLAYAQAMRAANLTGVTRRAEVDAQLASVITDAAVRAFLLQNLVLDSTGARWRVNLPVLEAAMPVISSFPEVPAGLRYDKPTLFIAGGRSSYVLPEHEDVIRPLFPRARPAVVRSAGHWVHAERPDDVVEILTDFLDG